jgi:hypothetical protein
MLLVMRADDLLGSAGSFFVQDIEFRFFCCQFLRTGALPISGNGA